MKTFKFTLIFTLLIVISVGAEPAKKVMIPNPASEYCIKQGGKLVFKKDHSGSQYGICEFDDGTTCEEWAFFRAECINKYQDPFWYCKAVLNIDKPQSILFSDTQIDTLIQAMTKQGIIIAEAPNEIKQNFSWRCMDGEVYVCHYGANIPCDEKADISKVPTESLQAYCKENPQSDIIPAYVSKKNSIYEWQCKNAVAVIAKQRYTVDKSGFISEFWQTVKR